MKIIIMALVVTYISPSFAKHPLIIGHRGSSGYLPEHTMSSYRLAIEQGADFIEPDLVMTKDGVLISRHENEISETTDVEKKFPDRKTTKMIDGESKTGWFTEDFTLAEIKQLRAKERLPFRSHAHDFEDQILTFKEILELASKSAVGVYPELKHPSYFKNIGLPMERALVHDLKNFKAKVFIQCFELGTLKTLKTMTKHPLILLLEENVSLDLEALKKLRKTVVGIGPHKRSIVPLDAQGNLAPATALINNAHTAGLQVHPYTFRSDKEFLAKDYQGESEKEYLQFFELGADGVFSDFSDHAIRARDKFIKTNKTK